MNHYGEPAAELNPGNAGLVHDSSKDAGYFLLWAGLWIIALAVLLPALA